MLDNVDVNFHPPQIEFSRLNLEFTVMSTRFFRKLVEGGHVAGWDDPRLPTISGLRRRGYTPEMIRDFCERVGVTRQENRVAMELLDFCARQALEDTAPRGMAVLDPLPVTIVNYPSDEDETLEAPWHGKHPEMGTRAITFGRELAIEREDFMEDPPRKFRRLSPGGLVRLRYGYVVRCDEVVRDDAGNVVELRCTYFPESKSGSDTSGLKPKGVIHWVSRQSGRAAAVRVYDRLFSVPAPAPDNMAEELNPASLEVVRGDRRARPGGDGTERFQFERVGYFFKDPVEHSPADSGVQPDRDAARLLPPGADMTGALTDLRVVELGTLIAGPFCGQLFGDMGAEVIKVEPPGTGDPMRAWGRGLPVWWPVIARNKKSVTLNLREPKGQELLKELAAHADVLIENFRPGTLERWGLDFERCPPSTSGW